MTQKVLRKEVLVHASIEELWRLWTTVEGVKTFFAPDAAIELKAGGTYEMYF
ncbi:SRPBCC domain-containing protein, partial [bacterium]|nr:SRPBCC domain-containing protein [bacterium]